jgi:hypothetical protein
VGVSPDGSHDAPTDVRLGDPAGIGSPQQIWYYEDGMFRSDSQPHMCMGVPRWRESSSLYMAQASHPISLMGCNKDQAAQRWLLGDDDRVHSAVDFDLCLTALPFWQKRPRFTMTLHRCTSDNNLNNNEAVVAQHQRFMLVGNGTATFLEPFVHSMHSDYETHDMVRLAFWTKDDTATALDEDIVAVPMLEIFNAEDVLHEEGQSSSAEPAVSPIYKEAISSHSNVIKIPAWKLFSSKNDNDDGPITLVARLGTVQSAEFTIHHPEPKKDSPTAAAAAASKTDPAPLGASSSPEFSLSSRSSVSWVTIVGIVVGIAMLAAFVAILVVRRVVASRKEKDKESKTKTVLPSHLSVDKPTTTTTAAAAGGGKDDEDARTVVDSDSVTGDIAIL